MHCDSAINKLNKGIIHSSQAEWSSIARNFIRLPRYGLLVCRNFRLYLYLLLNADIGITPSPSKPIRMISMYRIGAGQNPEI
ncbi:hypothetical protein M514_13530 [Trichuris suis]|uniref:Uncharacterized protein n=1 Tax=Trichuris suis TaxID=68888 RepID=A0A085LKU9_9BILA|nr:hypothetical protein M513_13530 [Trichuris suis]KFD71143.1 hypothetical protein M514_13530 [Trichuris suis]